MAIKLMDTLETAGDFPIINAPSVGLPTGERLDALFDDDGKIKSDSLPPVETADSRLDELLDDDGNIKAEKLPDIEASDPRLDSILDDDGNILESALPEIEATDPRVDDILDDDGNILKEKLPIVELAEEVAGVVLDDEGKIKEDLLPEISAADSRLDDLLKNPVILPGKNLSFSLSSDFGVYIAESTPQMLGIAPVTAGTKYLVQWGNDEFEETAFSGELPGFGSFVAIGNGAPYGLPGSDAPFLIAINEFGVAFFAGADSTPSRWVGIKEAEVKIKESYLPEEKKPESIDLTQYASNGIITENHADGSTVTHTIEFNAEGKPVSVTTNGVTTTLTW